MSEPTVIDLSDRVGPGYRTRLLADLDGIGVHHTVSGGDWGSLALDRTDEERVNHALAIDAYHRWKGYGGIGYSNLVFANGLITHHGPLTQQRAGVAHHNQHLVSFAFVGDLTDGRPTDEALASAAWLMADYFRQMDEAHPVFPGVIGLWIDIKGHAAWNTDPAWATACPGRGYELWLPGLIAMVVKEGETMSDVVREVAKFLGESPETFKERWRYQQVRETIRVAAAAVIADPDDVEAKRRLREVAVFYLAGERETPG